jgi:hypothetical protein
MGASLVIEDIMPEIEIPKKYVVSNVEFRNVGQSNKIGMHPIRFFSLDEHIGATIFVAQNNTIHTSYNRGIALSGTTNAVIQNNVLFDIRGHSIFNEFAHERNNTIANNMVVSTRKAFNLLDSDLQPASYWITNPANILVNNTASGSDAHGFFYNLPENSLGPLANTDICP